MRPFLLLLLLPLLLLGCGEDRSGLLPKKESRILQRKLDQAAEIHYGGNCLAALKRTEEARAVAEDLRGVDPRLRKNILRGIDRFQILVQDRCSAIE